MTDDNGAASVVNELGGKAEGSPLLQVARLVPGAGFSMTEAALKRIGRLDVIQNLSSVDEVRSAKRPLHVVPLGGVWNFLPNGEAAGALASLQQAHDHYGGFDSLTVVFDAAGEGFNFYPEPHRIIAEQLSGFGLTRDKTFMITSRLDPERSYETWCAEVGQEPVMHMVYVPVQLYFYAGIYRENVSLEFLDSVVAGRSPTLSRARSKNFLNLNFMPREARWATLLALMDEGLLGKGYVSFYGRAATQSVGEPPSDLGRVRSQLRELRISERIISRLDELEAMTPITLDEPSGSRIEKAYGLADQDYWGDVYFAIMTESDFPAHAGSRFSEKVLKPLVNLLPFVLIGTPGTLKELRRLGFMTFGGFIDETYDEIEDPAERLGAALRETTRLAHLSTSELQAMYAALWPRLVHNLMHLLTITPHLVDGDEGLLALSARARYRTTGNG